MRMDAKMGPGARFAAIDVGRGAALVAMIAYHLSWDLGFLGFIETDVTRHPAGVAVARGIAGTFLFLVGVGLVLAHGERIRPRPFLIRLAMVAGAALLVTVVTRLAFPEAYIFFGILHAIALFSLLALPFLRLPSPLVALAGAAVLVAPALWRSPAFDPRPLAWIGFYERPPPTVDFEPVFPWFGVTLMGVAVARIVLGRPRWREALQRWRAEGRIGGGLAWMGRRSLLIYLVHQPILLAVLLPLAWLRPVDEAAELRSFLRECERSCVAGGRTREMCAQGCSCAAEGIRSGGLWRPLHEGRLDADQEGRVVTVTEACFRQGR